MIHNFYGLFFISGLSFLFGSILGVNYHPWELFGICIGILILGLAIKKGKYITILIITILIGYSLSSMNMMGHKKAFNTLAGKTNNFSQSVSIIGKVETLLYKKTFSSVYRLRIEKIDTYDIGSIKDRQEKLSIFVEIPSNLHISDGDIIGFHGKIEQNIHFPLIGYDRYSLFQGGYGISKIYTYKKIYSENTSFIQNIKSYWEDTFRHFFPDSVAGILLGITIGSIDLLEGDIKNDFIKSGISHILVVSGSNIAFLILFLTFFMKYLPIHRIGRIVIIGCVLVFYGSLVGWGVSVIRAIIMGIISYITVEHGKKGWGDFSLLFSCILLTLYNPLSLTYDAGFGLSFGATFGIIVLHPYIENLGERFHIPKWIRSTLSISIGASLGSLPAIVYHFGGIPIGGILINILIGWTLGWILFTSVFLVGIYALSNFIGYLFGYIIYLPTKYIILLGDIFSHGPILIIPEILKAPIASLILGIYTMIFIKKNWERDLK